MNIEEKVKKLQSKPEPVRKQILALWMFISVFVVGGSWYLTLHARFAPNTVAKASDDLKPFKLFGQSISSTYSDITASVGNAKNVMSPAPAPVKDAPKVPDKVIDLIPVDR